MSVGRPLPRPALVVPRDRQKVTHPPTRMREELMCFCKNCCTSARTSAPRSPPPGDELQQQQASQEGVMLRVGRAGPVDA